MIYITMQAEISSYNWITGRHNLRPCFIAYIELFTIELSTVLTHHSIQFTWQMNALLQCDTYGRRRIQSYHFHFHAFLLLLEDGQLEMMGDLIGINSLKSEQKAKKLTINQYLSLKQLFIRYLKVQNYLVFWSDVGISDT